MSFRRTLGLGAGAVLAASCAAGACADPTQITVTVTTDLTCAMSPMTMVTGGHGEGTTDHCERAGELSEIGSIVLVPSRAKDDAVNITVVTRVGGADPTQCNADAPDGTCIVARRRMRFIPRTPLPITIQMRAACLGHACKDGETCILGNCVSLDDPAFHDEGDAGSTLDASGLVDVGTDGAPGDAPSDGSVPVDAPSDVVDASLDGADGGPLSTCVPPGPPVLWLAPGPTVNVGPRGMSLTPAALVWVDANAGSGLRVTSRGGFTSQAYSAAVALVGAYGSGGALPTAYWTTKGATESLYYGQLGATPSLLLINQLAIPGLSVDASGNAAVTSTGSATSGIAQVYSQGTLVGTGLPLLTPPGDVVLESTTSLYVGTSAAIEHVTTTFVTPIRNSLAPVGPLALVPTSTNICWAENNAAIGLVYCGPRQGPNVGIVALASGLRVQGIALAKGMVYWHDSAGVYAHLPGPVGSEALVAEMSNVTALAADDACVYIGTTSGIYRYAP
jgi:hypothetical protein